MGVLVKAEKKVKLSPLNTCTNHRIVLPGYLQQAPNNTSVKSELNQKNLQKQNKKAVSHISDAAVTLKQGPGHQT